MVVAEMKGRLDSNLKRVEILVELFDQVESRGSPAKTDVLRAAVVFLHATLEDVIRSALELRLPEADDDHLGMLKFAVGNKLKDHITISELARHREKTVDQLIRERIAAYLERSNFNDVADLVTALKRIALDTSLLEPHQDDLAAMMRRRHWIVHRADHNRDTGSPNSIDVQAVTAWKDAISTFCYALLARLISP